MTRIRHHRDGWWTTAFFGLHYDLHARANDTVLGAELTPKHLREQLEKVRPDFVQCDCKGHPGYAGYPTKVGTPSPGIVRDALRIHRDVTREMGIPLSVHFSGIWDEVAVAKHPDWAALDVDGNPINPRPPDQHGIVCPRGPYLRELMIPQLLELVDEYDIDGIWIDGDNWAVRDCYCPRCREAFRAQTGMANPPAGTGEAGWNAWRAFQREGFVEYVRAYADAVHARKPSCAVCSNWMYTMRQPGPVAAPVDYLSGDFTASFGCERAEMEGRYMDGHRMPWNLMAWTFCSATAAAPRQAKSATHLYQETAEVMSCGGAVFLYDQPQRTGWLNTWHQDTFAAVAGFVRARQPFSQFTESIPEATLLFSDPHVWRNNPMPFCLGDGYFGLEGALHILIENQWHVDVLDETRLLERIQNYSLVVVPEQDPVSPKVFEAAETYARNGGTVLLTGAHLADVCPDLVGVESAGAPVSDNAWIATGEASVGIAGPWRPVRATGSRTMTPVLRDQQPDKDETEFAAVTVREIGKGHIVAIHGDFMRTYYATHHPLLRRFMRHLLDDLKVSRRVRVTSSPSIEVSLRQGNGFQAVHLVNRAVQPTLTPRCVMVETVPTEQNVHVRLALEAKPQRVTLEPGARKVDWTYGNGWLDTVVPSVDIHDILVAHTAS